MNWEKTDSDQSYSRISGMDVFADWHLGPGFKDFSHNDDQSLIPCTIGPLDADMIRAMQPFFGSDAEVVRHQRGVFIPWLYREMTVGQYVVCFVKRQVFDDLARDDGALKPIGKMPKQIDLGTPLKAKSLPEHWKVSAPVISPLPPPVFQPAHWPDETVVIGIIDDGIAFAHEQFKVSNGTTRVQYFWRQDGVCESSGSTVGYGSELCKLSHKGSRGIDDLLKDHLQADLVDEEALYRQAGVADFGDSDHKALAWQRSHGTHVLYHAAGYDPSSNRVDRPIVAVQLPVSVTANTSGSNLRSYTLDAITYILDRADRLAGKGRSFPVVINFSYGMIAGPHDGTLEIEQTIDALAASRAAPVRVVLPSGNANLSRCHARFKIAGIGTQKLLHWRVQPDDLTATFMEIWLPHDHREVSNRSRVTIQIRTPFGETSPELTETVGEGAKLVSNGAVVGSVCYTRRPFPTERGVFAIALDPTARLGDELDSPTSTAPSGLWTITITNTALEDDEEVNAWIQWDDVIYGYPRRGRQSYFEAECYVRFDPVSGDIVDADPSGDTCHVRRIGTINAIATGRNSIVVGGVQQKDLRSPKYSASGPASPTRRHPPHRIGPDAACVTDDSRIHAGILGSGSRSGSMVLMSGTSVAVPQIVRLVADMLADGNPGDRDSVRYFAEQNELAHQWTMAAGAANPLPPLVKERSGAGRIVQSRRSRPRGIA